WLAGAQIAVDGGKLQTADQRYDLALQMAPRDALPLRKQIFETEAMDLYRRGEAKRLKALVDQATSELAHVDDGAKLKLKVLADLSTSPNKPKRVKSRRSREAVTWRARGDIDLIEILGPDALKGHAEEEYIGLLHKTAERFGGRYRSSSNVLKKLTAWEVRAF